MKSDNERTLRMEIPGTIVSKTSEDPIWTDLSLSNGWLAVPGSLSIYWAGSIDLAGYVMDKKTFYPAGGVIQEGPQWFTLSGEGALAYTIVSSVPIDAANLVLQLSSNAGPGFISNPGAVPGQTGTLSQNWETVIFAQSELLIINTTLPTASGILQPITSKQSGSLSPTAADTLFVVKMVVPFGTTLTQLGAPASRVLLPGMMDQEPDLEYIMRIKRSYELANQV